jgi:hypothetical protein
VKVPGSPHGNLRPAAANEYSIGAVARYGLLVLLAAGAGALITAEFLTIREIRAVTVVPPDGTASGGELHGYALGVIGVAALVLSYGAAVRGARPAAVALIVLAIAAWGVVLGIDRPALDDEGIIGRTYALAEARPGPGFTVEAAGAGLLLLGGVAALVLAPAGRSGRARRRTPGEPDLSRR